MLASFLRYVVWFPQFPMPLSYHCYRFYTSRLSLFLSKSFILLYFWSVWNWGMITLSYVGLFSQRSPIRKCSYLKQTWLFHQLGKFLPRCLHGSIPHHLQVFGPTLPPPAHRLHTPEHPCLPRLFSFSHNTSHLPKCFIIYLFFKCFLLECKLPKDRGLCFAHAVSQGLE